MSEPEKKPEVGWFTAEQLREKLKSGEYKIESAPQYYVNQYEEEVHKLLLLVGELMSEDPKDWADNCFVTDQSTLSDFFSREEDEEEGVVKGLSKKLGFEVERSMYIYEIAARMHGVQ